MKKYFKRIFIMLITLVMLMGTLLPTYAKKSIIEYSVDGNGKNYVTVSETGDYLWSSSFGSGELLYREIGNQKSYVKTEKEVYSNGLATTIQYRAFLIRGMNYYYDTDDLNLIYKEKKTVITALENMISNLVYSIGNGFYFLVSLALGESLTIDDLVFNNYIETDISFFERSNGSTSSLIYGDGGIASVINKAYAFFIKIAFVGYMAMLVYMGIRIMLASTSEKKAEYKKFFMDWIIGLTILFLFPYAMKYIIRINEAYVEMIEANKGYDFYPSAVKNENYDISLLEASIEDSIDWSSGTDYMSQIAFTAWQTEKLALSIAFLIMTWQLISLVFYYYKRLFMIAFLITIFPLVAFTYAVDKIADGKTQAFNTWLKEFVLNVFVQSFHATIYVLVCSTIYSAAGTDASVGYDFILVIVGVTFLFKGEEIIRKIFGQESAAGTMKSLSESAAGTYAKFAIATSVIKGTASVTVGEKSVVNKLNRGRKELQLINSKMKAFDKTATKSQNYNIGDRLEHAPKKPGEGASADEIKKYKQERKYYQAAAVVNNPNSHSYQERARALNTLKNLAKDNPDHDVFKDTYATAGQFRAMADLDRDVQKMMTSGMARTDIEREVTLRMGVVFPSDSDEKVKDRVNNFYTDLFLNGANSTVSKAKVRKDVQSIMNEVNSIQSSIKFGADEATLTDEEKNRRASYYTTVQSTGDSIYAAYEASTSDSDKSVAREYARRIAILNARSSGEFTREQILETSKFVRDHADDNDTTRRMLENEFGIDVDIFTHTLARKIKDTAAPHEIGGGVALAAINEVHRYEDDARAGYFDDAISAHEVIQFKDNASQLDAVIDNIYTKKKESMDKAVSAMAKEYLTDNDVDIVKGSQDTTLRTQDGYTESELLAMKIDAIGRTLSNLAAVNKTSASSDSGAVGITGWVMKEYMAKKEEERTGITRTLEEKRNVNNWLKTSNDYVEERRAKREEIDRAHFLGDIGDRKDE